MEPTGLAIGDVVAKHYVIEGIVGEGGTATVYRGRSTRSGIRVALKLMHATQEGGLAEQQRFAREAELVKQLRHPHVVRLMDYGVLGDGQPYLVFPLLEGRSLEERLATDGALGGEETGRIARQILSALDVAHAMGVVHRDVKPANIFLKKTSIGEVVQMLDFGLAKVVGQGGKGADDELARPGEVVGTPRYMAPEQARGEQVGQSADIYALGLIMAEMLTGEPVVQGASDIELYAAQGSDQPHELAAAVLDSPFATIIMRATDKSPAVRYRLASQMLADLESVLTQQSRPDEPLTNGSEDDSDDDFGEDFEVTELVDGKSLLQQLAASNPTSEQLRAAFNRLAASKGSAGAEPLPPSSRSPQAAGPPSQSEPTAAAPEQRAPETPAPEAGSPSARTPAAPKAEPAAQPDAEPSVAAARSGQAAPQPPRSANARRALGAGPWLEVAVYGLLFGLSATLAWLLLGR